MRESCSYGSVGERGGNEPLYLESAMTIAIIVKKKDSSINCLTSLVFEDPRVLRTPTSKARLVDLAVARFIKLMQAMIIIKTAIAENIYIYEIFPLCPISPLILEFK